MAGNIWIGSILAEECYKIAVNFGLFTSATLYHHLDSEYAYNIDTDDIQELIEKWVQAGIAKRAGPSSVMYELD